MLVNPANCRVNIFVGHLKLLVGLINAILFRLASANSQPFYVVLSLCLSLLFPFSLPIFAIQQINSAATCETVRVALV